MDGFRKRGVTLNLLQKEGGTQKGELPSEKGIPTLEETMHKLEASINLEAKSISTILKISDSVERIARAPPFVTLKDHKDNFRSNPTYRLINPPKNELVKVIKQLVKKINSGIIEKMQLNQWRSADTVLKCCNNITDKIAVLFSLTLKNFTCQ